MKTKWGKGITLVEVVGILAIIVLLIGIFPCSCSPIKEQARQKVCGQNLAGIGRGMLQYSGLSNESALMLPLLADPNGTGRNPNVKIGDLVGTDDPNLPIAELGGKGNINAMQNFWPMIVRSFCQEKHFQCPSDEGHKSRRTFGNGGTDKNYGWTSMKNLSYGVQWCYPDSNNRNVCDPTSTSMNAKAVIMADRNPGGSVTNKVIIVKPSNHPKDGENVLFRDGSVKLYYKTSDSWAGKAQDDIYVNNAGLIAPPTARPDLKGSETFDTIIVPAYAGDPTTGRSK